MKENTCLLITNSNDVPIQHLDSSQMLEACTLHSEHHKVNNRGGTQHRSRH
jgi:hypothetical protein